jgi:hypothetical protein
MPCENAMSLRQLRILPRESEGGGLRSAVAVTLTAHTGMTFSAIGELLTVVL